MRFSLLALAAGTALTFAPAAQAAPIGSPEGLRAAIDGVSITEQAQFLFGGRQYCFYPNGWRGAGWYRCGFHLRRGLGWGGPMGWQGWSYERGPRFGRSERNFRGEQQFRGGREFRGERRLGVEGGMRGGTTGQGSQSFEGRRSRGPQGGSEMQRGPQQGGPDMHNGAKGGQGGSFGGGQPR